MNDDAKKEERPFGFLKMNERGSKSRQTGIMENVRTWRSDVPQKIASVLGIDKVMFEAADPAVFSWYVKNYGPDVNLFIDHSQIVQLECLRRGIRGTMSLWGRVVTYRG
jgi:phosphosulfolactate synthase (CoM biosynthesis protein A)